MGSSYPGTEDTDDLSHDFDLDFDVFGNTWENLFEHRADPDPVVEIRAQNYEVYTSFRMKLALSQLLLRRSSFY